MSQNYESAEPARADVDAMRGPVVLEFGNAWCGYCRGAQPLIAEAFARHASVHHVKVADGSGRRLGRSFRVKLWPTLVFLRDGEERARVVRPSSVAEIADAFDAIDPPAGGAAP